MTLKDFSRKYGVPYFLVYAASYSVKRDEADRDYNEKELFIETSRVLTKRIEKFKKLMDQNVKAKKSMYSKIKKKGG